MSRASMVLLVLAAALAACSPPVNNQPEYDEIFVTDRLVPWELTLSAATVEQLWRDPAVYAEAALTVDGVDYPRVGVRLMGGQGSAKTSLRIRFNEYDPELRFHGVKRINLRRQAGDPSMIREALALDRLRAIGVPAPLCSFVSVRKNGLPWGVFTLVEQIDKKFLERNFGEDTGNLYKLDRFFDCEEGSDCRDEVPPTGDGSGPVPSLVYAGESAEDYVDLEYRRQLYERKTNDETTEDIESDLIDFMRLLEESSGAALKGSLEGALDLDGWLTLLAFDAWAANLDNYAGTADNLHLYRHSDGRFRVIPWDTNQAFGNFHKDGYGALTTDAMLDLDPDEPMFEPAHRGPRPLVEKILAVAEWRERFHQILGGLIDGELAPAAVEARVDTWTDLIRAAAREDANTEYTVEEFDAALDSDILPHNTYYDPEVDDPVDDPVLQRAPGLIPFIQARDSRVREAL